MILSPRTRKYWASVVLDHRFSPSRTSILRTVLALFVLCIFAYLLWLPISYLLTVFSSFFSHHSRPVTTFGQGADAFERFVGSQDCNIKQTDIYIEPYWSNSKASPFCSTRAALLEALSNGGRHGYDEPYVGKGCTSRWFGTSEACMVLERFNGLVFVGDDIARAVYVAFNILLREDLAYGGLQGSRVMGDQDREDCKCDKQFLDECAAFGITNWESLRKTKGPESSESSYYCERVPHAYIPVEANPASPEAISVFKDLTYQKPNPWQPTPMIFSFGHASSFDIEMSTAALDEWLALATGAERNIPMLFLSPPAIRSSDSNTAVWQYHQQMSTLARKKHVDVLGLYNLTLQATSMDEGRHYGERVALTEAMMIVNWLSKLETS